MGTLFSQQSYVLHFLSDQNVAPVIGAERLENIYQDNIARTSVHHNQDCCNQ